MPNPMSLGQLRQRITLVAPVPHESRTGAGKTTYRDAERVSAAVRNLLDYEVARFRQQSAKAEREVTIRRRDDIDTGWRITHSGITYQVESIVTDEHWSTLKVFKVGA